MKRHLSLLLRSLVLLSNFAIFYLVSRSARSHTAYTAPVLFMAAILIYSVDAWLFRKIRRVTGDG